MMPNTLEKHRQRLDRHECIQHQSEPGGGGSKSAHSHQALESAGLTSSFEAADQDDGGGPHCVTLDVREEGSWRYFD
jgi:hypothetical protein